VPTKTVDHAEIAKRFQEFTDVFKGKPYQRQKSALELQLLDFLATLSRPKDVSSCTSDDIIRFLISKDKSGKTVLHSQSCSKVHCNCPTRLAAGSVDSLLGKLRAIFNNLGRLHDSNPVAHTRVREYLKCVREEEAGKAIVPLQAVPLFFVEFSKLICFLRRSVEASAHPSVVNKYILGRDATFRTTDRRKVVSSRPFLGSAVNNRLRKHLTEAKIDCGETPHSFRLGLSNTLNMMGCSPDEISRYVGWRNGNMVNHYTKMSTVAGSSPITRRHLSSTESLDQTPISHPSNLQCIF